MVRCVNAVLTGWSVDFARNAGLSNGDWLCGNSKISVAAVAMITHHFRRIEQSKLDQHSIMSAAQITVNCDVEARGL